MLTRYCILDRTDARRSAEMVRSMSRGLISLAISHSGWPRYARFTAEETKLAYDENLRQSSGAGGNALLHITSSRGPSMCAGRPGRGGPQQAERVHEYNPEARER